MNKPVMIIAIDPGAAGGVAFKIGETIGAFDMPSNQDFFKWINEHAQEYKALAVIEHQQLRPDDATDGRMFGMQKLLANYNKLSVILETNYVAYKPVSPISWQSKLKLRVKGHTKVQKKNSLKQFAQKEYPHLRVTLKTADALCMLKFAIDKAKYEPEFYNNLKTTK